MAKLLFGLPLAVADPEPLDEVVYTVGVGEYLLGVVFSRIKNSVKKYPPRVRITYYDLWREKRFELGTCYCLGFLKSPIQ